MIADLRYHGYRAAQSLQAPFSAVDAVLRNNGLNDELKHWNAVRDKLAHGGIAFLQTQITGIHAIRGHGNEGLTGELLLAVKGAHGGLLPCLIAVEGIDELAIEVGIIQHEPAQYLQVLAAKSGTTGSNGGLDACGIHSHDIRVALYHHGLVLFGDVALGQIEAKEHLGLPVEHGLGGVHVLAELVVVEKLARAKTNDVAGKVLNRPQQATMEAVDGTTFAHLGDAGCFQFFKGKA